MASYNHPVAMTRRIKELAQKKQLAILTDLDGTLTKAPPGVHDTVTYDGDLESILNNLHDASNGAFVVVTGRPHIFVENLMPKGRFPVATEHGAVVADNVAAKTRVRSAKYDFSAISSEVSQRVAHINGAYVEDYKCATLTLQFTDAADPEGVKDFMRGVLEDAVKTHGDAKNPDPLIIVCGCVKGNYTIDIIPQSADKAEAVKHFMSMPNMNGKVPVFCGDSNGDKTAMEMVQKMGGIAIGVGDGAPACADIRLKDIHEMRLFFEMVTGHMTGLTNTKGGPQPKP